MPTDHLIKALKQLPADRRRRVRAALGFIDATQADLAKATGIGPVLLSDVLSGYRNLTPEQEQAVAAHLGVPASVLFPEVAA